ncbi:MAG: hypothetical protein NT169_24415 [Chloroflexi bacterium]|nr:hypothetical protein [Chloroflexota bacterium]
MEHQTTVAEKQMSRQPWEEPAIVLERSLEARAQDSAPGSDSLNPLSSFLGPLKLS